MDKSVIRGLIIGAVFAVLGTAAVLSRKLMASQTEVARRTKVVLGICLGLTMIMFVVGMFGMPSAVIAAVIVAAIYWIRRGKKLLK